jgi:hypothetical protein
MRPGGTVCQGMGKDRGDIANAANLSNIAENAEQGIEVPLTTGFVRVSRVNLFGKYRLDQLAAFLEESKRPSLRTIFKHRG